MTPDDLERARDDLAHGRDLTPRQVEVLAGTLEDLVDPEVVHSYLERQEKADARRADQIRWVNFMAYLGVVAVLGLLTWSLTG